MPSGKHCGSDLLDVLLQEYNKLRADLNNLISKFNTHTHRADGAQTGQYNTSRPQSDAQTVTPVTAVTASLSAGQVDKIP